MASSNAAASDEPPPCLFFARGKCRNGNQCPFSHTTGALPPCNFHVRGLCRNGDACSFSHLSKELPLCKFYAKGLCRNGDACSFSHTFISEPEPAIEPVQQLVLSHIERLFWVYYDEVVKGNAEAPRGQLTEDFHRFASLVVGAVPTLLPTNGRPLMGMLQTFENAKQFAPRSYIVMLDKALTQVVMVKRLHNPWWFLPGGKQEPQESPRIAALREAYEETGLDVTPYMVNAEIVLKKCLRPTRVWVATNVPEDFPFAPKTIGEVAEVGWRPLDSYADIQANPNHWVSQVLGLVRRVKACEGRPGRLKRRRVERDTPDLTVRFDTEPVRRDAFMAALYNYSSSEGEPSPSRDAAAGLDRFGVFVDVNPDGRAPNTQVAQPIAVNAGSPYDRVADQPVACPEVDSRGEETPPTKRRRRGSASPLVWLLSQPGPLARKRRRLAKRIAKL